MSDNLDSRLESTYDRMAEAKFWAVQMGVAYHQAGPFRWTLNSFLRSLKEVPQLVRMELQGVKDFKKWIATQEDLLRQDGLINLLGKKRDVVVHQKMLRPLSKCTIGICEGVRGMRLWMGGNVNPDFDSDKAMEWYIERYRTSEEPRDFLAILAEDEDTEPCVEREWKLPEFDDELVTVASNAWNKMANHICDVTEWLGCTRPVFAPLSDEFRLYTYQTYDRDELRRRADCG